MNLRRFTLTFGVGLLVGFGLVTASRSRPHRPLCSEEIHASDDHEMKALVEQTKDDTSALSEMLRCASPETFHRLVSVYFPDQTKPQAQDDRVEAIGKDETWLLTAWEKLVKRQDEGAENPATPADSATDDAADDVATETATVTQDVPTASDPPPDDTATTDPVPDPQPEPTASDPAPDTETEVDEPTSVEDPLPSSTEDDAPEPTTEEPVSSDPPQPTTSSTSEEEPEVTTTEPTTEPTTTTTSTSTSEEPESETSTSEDEEDDRTTIHVGSSAVRETITSINADGGATTITSTSWVSVDPPEETGEDGESDPSLQDAGPSLRANIGPAALIGGIVTVLLMS